MAEYIERDEVVRILEKYGLTNGAFIGQHCGTA